MEDTEYREMFAVEDTHWWFVARRLFLSKIFTQMGILPGKSMKIADIGAGTGGMELFLSSYGDATGVEPNIHGRTFAKKRGVLLKKGTAEKTGLPHSSYDLVCFFDVLYHKNIHEKKALKEAWRIVKPGGWLVVTDCAAPWLTGPHDVAVAGRERYTLGGLAGKIEMSGFRLRKTSYMFCFMFPIFVLKRLLDRYFHYGRISSDVRPLNAFVNSIFYTVCVAESLLLPFISYPWGSSVVVISQKPKKE